MEAVSESTVVGVEDQDATLRFNVTNDIPKVVAADVTWTITFANGSMQVLASDSDIRYMFSVDMLILTIDFLQASDEGSYTLMASNAAGTDSASIFLDVQGKVAVSQFSTSMLFLQISFTSTLNP